MLNMFNCVYDESNSFTFFSNQNELKTERDKKKSLLKVGNILFCQDNNPPQAGYEVFRW